MNKLSSGDQARRGKSFPHVYNELLGIIESSFYSVKTSVEKVSHIERIPNFKSNLWIGRLPKKHTKLRARAKTELLRLLQT